MTRLLVLGASGAGTSTLGAALGAALGWAWLDLDDYFWERTEPPFTTRRERTQRLASITAALARHEQAVVSGCPLGWGSAIEDGFDLIVFLTLDPAARLARLRARELARFGVVNEAFLAWAARYDDPDFTGRSRTGHEAWLAARDNVLRLDGAIATDAQVARVRRHLAGT